MGNFQLKIDVEPNDIPSLDDPHKQDCADALNRVINGTFKYTMIFAFVVMGAYAAYSIFGLVYVLRMGVPLPGISPLIPLFAMFIIIFELVAGTMKRWAIVTEVIFHIALMICSVTQIASLLALPFAAYGIYLHIKMMTLIPHYEVISNLKGFPDFTSLPIGEVVKKADAEEEKTEVSEEETNSPAEETSSTAEKQETVKEETTSPVEKAETAKEETSSPAEETETAKEEISFPAEKAETATEETNSPTEETETAKKETSSPAEETETVKSEASQPRKSNNSSRKKKKRKKSSK